MSPLSEGDCYHVSQTVAEGGGRGEMGGGGGEEMGGGGGEEMGGGFYLVTAQN